jgi:hypothetical protein
MSGKREHVHLRAGQLHSAFQEISGRSDGGAGEQPPLVVLGGVREIESLLNVLDGNQALEVEILIHDEQFFNPVLLQHTLGFLERRAHGHRDQVLLGHHGADRLAEVLLEAQVPVGQDAHEKRPPRHRESGDAVLRHDVHRFAHGKLGRNGHRVHDHPAFGALHAVDFLGLPLDRHAAVHKPEPALARHRDRQARFSHRVHRRGHQRNVQGNFSGQPGLCVDLGGQHRGFPRQQ